MNIIHTLELDLQRHDSRQFIYCKQGDSETRSVEISLYNNGSTWKVPEDASIIRICYAKPDRTGACMTVCRMAPMPAKRAETRLL